MSDTNQERWHHEARGTTYTEVGDARVQCPADKPLQDNEIVLLYRNIDDGTYSVRRHAEFHDGRFKKVTDLKDTTCPATGRPCTQGCFNISDCFYKADI